MIRIKAFLGLCLGPTILGKYHITPIMGNQKKCKRKWNMEIDSGGL